MVPLFKFSVPRFLTINKFLTQVASKSCIRMHLFGSVLNLFDAVVEVCNTSWCYHTKQHVMKWGYGSDRKIIHLLHDVVVFNVGAIVWTHYNWYYNVFNTHRDTMRYGFRCPLRVLCAHFMCLIINHFVIVTIMYYSNLQVNYMVTVDNRCCLDFTLAFVF